MFVSTIPVFSLFIVFNNFMSSNQHFIQSVSECVLSEICNHTWTPMCAKEKTDLDYKLFSDDCQRHEYNCDNKKDYVAADIWECIQTTSFTTTTTEATTTTTTITTTPTTTPALTTTTEPPKTSEIKPHPISLNSNCSRIRATPKPCSTTTVATTTKGADTTKQTTTTPTPTTTQTPTTTTNTPTITTDISTTITQTPTTTTQTPTTTNKPTTTTQISMTTTTTSPTTSQTPSLPSTSSTTVTATKVTKQTTNVDENTIPQNKVICTPIPQNKTCSPYSKDCDRPVTWETTVKGETRDFYQILRERYGSRVKLLRATTHWPRKFLDTPKGSFIFGRHSESNRNNKL